MTINQALDYILSLEKKTKETEELKQKLFNAKMKHGGRTPIDSETNEEIEKIKSDI